ncbi:MAG: peptidoglycan-binding protein LysM [Flavobacteriaceae bacterium]|nr:peptidoglycan-binding protein LysM [Flavobacteriaceae bacterium]
MGIFSFLSNSGKKTIDSTADNAVNASKLVNNIQSYGFDVTDLDIEIDGETAKVWGVAANQATREKVLLAIGNTKGIASVDDKMTTAVPEPEAKFYTVVSGDSLSKIAKKHYNDAMKYNEIFEANKPMLKDVNKIYPGQVLRIPNL